MPPKKQAEALKDAGECILRMGKSNNVVTWAEEMQTTITALYGLTGMFFETNKRYVPPLPREQDYMPAIPEPDTDDEFEGDEEQEEPDEIPAAVIAKLRENAYEGRRREIEKQKANERTVWPMMWSRMSPSSQSKVREQDGFLAAKQALDCVKLWELIRRTHLTHTFGDGDPMREVNVQEQESRYSALRQGDREYISTFKTRFDNQVKANEGAGVRAATETRLALDFILKLDPKRYRKCTAECATMRLRNYRKLIRKHSHKLSG